MLISQLMTRDPVSVRPDTPLMEAIRQMAALNVHHLPVTTSENVLVGIISDRDIRQVTQLPLLPVDDPRVSPPVTNLIVRDVMTPEPITTTPGATLREAAYEMRANKIGCLPVVLDRQLVGIVTRTDLFHCFLDLLEQRGARLFWDF
jgi:CBS domain-containing protein